jgi:hypothetical protein
MPPRSQWLRAGWPRGLVLLALVLPAMIAGAIQLVVHVGWNLSFAGGALVTVAVAAPFVRALGGRPLSAAQEVGAHAILVAVAAFAGALVYNRHFHGLPNYQNSDGWGGADGGYHVIFFWDFVKRGHDTYHGFVAMYSLWEALRRLGSRHLLVAIDGSLVYARVVAAVVPCAIAFSVLHRFRGERRAWWAGAVAALVATLAVQYLVVLPLLNFHTMGGFWAHVFGLVPLFFLWLADALVRPRLVRLAVLCAGLVLVRYTYALNLADLCGLFGALLVVEALGARTSPAWMRAALAAAAVAAFIAARHVFILSEPIFAQWGWVLEHDVGAAERGLSLAVVAGALTMLAWPVRGAAAHSGIVRALRFPVLFAAADLIVLAFVRRLPPTTFYYFNKYDVAALALAAGALVVVAAFWAALCASQARLPALAAALVAVAVATAGVVRMHRSLAAFDTGFREQVFGGPYERSYPWVMPATLDRIQRTLDDEHKAFGGYKSRHFAMRVTTNAIFDHGDIGWMHQPHLDDSPGHCIFWDRGASGHDKLPQRQCASYVQEPFPTVEVCSACF